MKKILIALGICIVIAAIFVALMPKKTDGYKHQSVAIAGKTFDVLLADTDALREKGLGDRASLLANEAMLFSFDKPDLYGFWMKDMRFPIDMIWLDASGKVVWVEKNVSPDTYPQSFFPKEPALYVVETNAGVADALDVEAGSVVALPEASR